MITMVAIKLKEAGQNHIKLPLLSEETLQTVLSSATLYRVSQLLYLTLPESWGCVLKHLEDGKTQVMFKLILALRNDDSPEYPAKCPSVSLQRHENAVPKPCVNL
jgi:hypothetical protein